MMKIWSVQSFILLIDNISMNGCSPFSAQAVLTSNIPGSTGSQKIFPTSMMSLTYLRKISNILLTCLHIKKRQMVSQRYVWTYVFIALLNHNKCLFIIIMNRNVINNFFASQPKEVIKKFYKSGRCFLTLCPDGTGNVLYPFNKCTKWKIKD